MRPQQPTRDEQCVRFLQWALPRLGYRWPGYRRVRRQVCRRVRRRIDELELAGYDDYARRLEQVPDEWARLDSCCRITISRFYRDRRLWEVLGGDVLPQLYARATDRKPPRIRFWSAGCGAGEEPYTLAMLLRVGPAPLPQGIDAEIVATDLDRHQLERASRACYPESSLRDLPASWRGEAFERESDESYRLIEPYTRGVTFEQQDIRRRTPSGRFDLILCRNLAFTYFDAETRTRCLERLLARLDSGGWLATGSHEVPPRDVHRLARHLSACELFTRTATR